MVRRDPLAASRSLVSGSMQDPLALHAGPGRRPSCERAGPATSDTARNAARRMRGMGSTFPKVIGARANSQVKGALPFDASAFCPYSEAHGSVERNVDHAHPG